MSKKQINPQIYNGTGWEEITTPDVISLEDRATNLESRADSLEGRATILEGRTDTLEGRTTTLENNVQQIRVELGESNNEDGDTLFSRTLDLENKLGNPTKEDDDPFTAQDAAFYRIEQLEEKIESFLKDAELQGEVIDTLKEIQDYISGDKTEANELWDAVNKRVVSTGITNSFYSVNGSGENANINFSFGTECLAPLRHEGRLFAEVNTELAAPSNAMNKQLINLGYFNDNTGSKTQEKFTEIENLWSEKFEQNKTDIAAAKTAAEDNSSRITSLETIVGADDSQEGTLVDKVGTLEENLGAPEDSSSETTAFGKIAKLNEEKISVPYINSIGYNNSLGYYLSAPNGTYGLYKFFFLFKQYDNVFQTKYLGDMITLKKGALIQETPPVKVSVGKSYSIYLKLVLDQDVMINGPNQPNGPAFRLYYSATIEGDYQLCPSSLANMWQTAFLRYIKTPCLDIH